MLPSPQTTESALRFMVFRRSIAVPATLLSTLSPLHYCNTLKTRFKCCGQQLICQDFHLSDCTPFAGRTVWHPILLPCKQICSTAFDFLVIFCSFCIYSLIPEVWHAMNFTTVVLTLWRNQDPIATNGVFSVLISVSLFLEPSLKILFISSIFTRMFFNSSSSI